MIRAFFRSLPLTGWAVVAAVLALVLLLATCAHHADRDVRRARALAEANARAISTDTAARAAAADQRLADTLRTLQTEKDLTDALKDLPDARPSDRRIALACERLRRQGDDPAAISACR